MTSPSPAAKPCPSLLLLPPPFGLRPMRPEDLPQVVAIDRLAHERPWSASGYEHELSANPMACYQVLLAQEVVIGFAGHWLMAGECHISTIAVHPRRRGQGLGKALMVNSLLIAHRQGATMATLEVRETNLVAQSLYRQLGFETVGRRKNYYHTEDALIMTLPRLDAAHLALLQGQAARLGQRLEGLGLSSPPGV